MPRPVVPIFSLPPCSRSDSRATSIAAWNGRISGQASLMRSRERTSTPAFSSPSISSSSLVTDSTTPLPM